MCKPENALLFVGLKQPIMGPVYQTALGGARRLRSTDHQHHNTTQHNTMIDRHKNVRKQEGDVINKCSNNKRENGAIVCRAVTHYYDFYLVPYLTIKNLSVLLPCLSFLLLFCQYGRIQNYFLTTLAMCCCLTRRIICRLVSTTSLRTIHFT